MNRSRSRTGALAVARGDLAPHCRPRARRPQPEAGVLADGARCAVAISFDADHETIPLRDDDESPMRISQGQYGDRQAMPRIRRLLERESIPATFFYPAVSALLHPEEVRAVADDGPRDRHPFLDPRSQHHACPARPSGN